MRCLAHAARLWLLVVSTFYTRSGCATEVVHVSPGQLHLCATAAEQAARDAEAAASEPKLTRCILAAGVYRENLVYRGHAPLEIIGAGQGITQLRGDEPLAGLSWIPSPDPETSGMFSADLPAGVLRTPGVQQAFFDDQWLPEARYPNTNLDKILQLTSWGFCGEGSAHGYCKDRPDSWSALPRKNWTGALATLSLGTRIATWTRKVTSYGPGWFTYPASLGPGPGTRLNNKPGARYFLSGVLAALDSPGEWFIDENDWTVYVWAPDSQSPDDRVSLRVRDFCVDTAHAAVTLQNLSMHACTFRLRNCTGCAVSDVNITYASYNRYLHLRDPQPFHRGPPPNITLMEGNNNSISRLALRYSNSAGLKVVGSYNRLEELLILDTDWLGTLDYPPLEIGFGNDCDYADVRNTNASGCRDVPPFPGMLEESTSEPTLALGDRMTMYPRNILGTDNTITRATVGRSGSAGIVTSQLSNEVSFSHVFGAGLIGLDDAGIHADNSRANNLHCGGDRCIKVWHHNWVHDCKAKCVRGDDFTKNLTLHHNMVWNCGEPKSDGAGQSFGVVLKGDYNKFYANTVLRTAQADVVICTGEEGPNKHTVIVNNVASRWSGKKGPKPPSAAQKNAGNWGGNVEAADTGMFVDFATFDFRPKNSSQLIGKGVLHPPEVLGPNQHPDAGAYQSSADAHPWRAGCTFSPECNASIPSPPPPPSPCAAPGAGWTCRQKSYCGPKLSFYWTGQLDLANCYAACAANSTGCSCFDHLTGPDYDSVGGGEAECRLHASATDIVTNEVSDYTAYWRNGSTKERYH